jgi:hypothetical protein
MISLICGKREEGKTTWALHLCEEWSPRTIVFDVRHQFRRDDFSIVESVDELAERCAEAGGIVVYRPQSIKPDEIIGVAEYVRAMSSEDDEAHRFSFLIDEAGIVANKGEAILELQTLTFFHRRNTLQVLFLAHRPSQIKPDFRAVIDYLYCFNMTEPRDLDFLSDMGVDEETIDVITRLAPHYLVEIEVGTREKPKVIADPESWYVDYGRSNYARV